MLDILKNYLIIIILKLILQLCLYERQHKLYEKSLKRHLKHVKEDKERQLENANVNIQMSFPKKWTWQIEGHL